MEAATKLCFTGKLKCNIRMNPFSPAQKQQKKNSKRLKLRKKFSFFFVLKSEEKGESRGAEKVVEDVEDDSRSWKFP